MVVSFLARAVVDLPRSFTAQYTLVRIGYRLLGDPVQATDRQVDTVAGTNIFTLNDGTGQDECQDEAEENGKC